MKMELHKKTIFSTIILIVSLLLVSILSIIEALNDIIAEILNLYGYVIFLWMSLTWKQERSERLFCPYLIFCAFFVVFNYGRPLLWALGMSPEYNIIPGTYLSLTIEQLNYVKILICFSMISLHLGALVYTLRAGNSAQISQKRQNNTGIFNKKDKFNKAMLFVGITVGSISIPFTIFRYISLYDIAMTSGYGAIYSDNDFSYAAITFMIEMFFFPSLLCVLIGGAFKKKYQFLVWSIFIVYMLINLMMGDRGTWIYKLIILIWLEINHYNINIGKFMLPYSLLGIVGLYFVYSVVALRDYGNITLDAVFENLKNVDFPIITGINEMGGSMNIFSYMIIYGTSFWVYQNTYITSILGIITSRYFSDLGIDLILIDDYFSSYLNLDYGTGFLMIAEAYLNFSWGYFFILGIFGYLFAMLFSRRNDDTLSLFVTTSSLAILIGWIRGSSYLYFKAFFYGVIVFWIAIRVIHKIKKS